MMQILNIVLYKDHEHRRVLQFNLGHVSIITGESKTGKTAIIDIIDYCLGSSDCRIADGKVRENVDWFGVTLQLSGEQLFIARQNPDKLGQKSTSYVFLIQGTEFSEPPEYDVLVNNTTTKALTGFLSSKLGIGEYENIPPEQTRDRLAVNFSHSRFYCFQPQNLVAQRDFLFYKQNEPFLPQTIKDTLPYFLGVVREDTLKIENEIRQKRRALRILQRKLNEANSIKAEGINKLYELLEEAKSVDLVSANTIATSDSDAIEILKNISEWEYSEEKVVQGDNEALNRLISIKNEIKSELNRVNTDLRSAEIFLNDSNGYSFEAKQQETRLLSIGLYKEPEEREFWHSILGKEVDEITPTIEAINESLIKLKNNLDATTQEKPRLAEYIKSLETTKEQLLIQIREFDDQINSIYSEREEAGRLRDLNIRKGRVIGRISLFMESLNLTEGFSELEQQIAEIKEEIEVLEAMISEDDVEEKLNSVLNRLNAQMTAWSKKLDVEYRNDPIRFDLKKLTIFADTPNKSVPLNQMGSGANWVSYHLLIHFALHQLFCQRNRPVPNFLIIDQPSQVYYPPEKDDELQGEINVSSDEKAVQDMYQFMFDITEELEGKFQVIITDHARLRTPDFEEAIIETWRNGAKLVPEDWYR